MTTRNFRAIFEPGSVALIGASARPSSVGATVLANLIAGGFSGPVWPVNPNYAELAGVRCYASIHELPAAPDLAVIATPAATVPDLVAQLGARGTRAAIVLSAGFAELGDAAGRALEQAMLEAARPHLMRIVGPNTIGLLVPHIGLNASFAHLMPAAGDIAFVSQSGALLTSVMDWAHGRGIGFSRLVALGSMADVDVGDLLDDLANDSTTRAILMYVEGIKAPRKFLSAARAAARTKPVLVCKSGRHDAGARAARTHTGAMAGSDAVYDCAFRRAGMLRVRDLEELFAAVEILATTPAPPGDRLAIVTNGGGLGVLAADALMDVGGTLATLDAGTVARLDAVLPPTWSRGNPIDLIGDAGPDRYGGALETLLEAPEVDATLVLHVPVSVADPTAVADAVVEAHRRSPHRTLLTNWAGGVSVSEARERFYAAGVATFEHPDDAIRGLHHLLSHRRLQRTLLEAPAAPAQRLNVDHVQTNAVIRDALEQGRTWLDADAARGLLGAYGIPTLPVRHATSIDAAATAAAEMATPVALKIRSPDLPHKTDVGGVLLDLEGHDAVAAAARSMLERVARERPDARIDGFSIEPMLRIRHGHELIVGAHVDAQFGPVLLFGHGGTAVEVLDDTALGLPPLNGALAREMIARTRIGRLLTGHRGLPGVDLDAVADVLTRVSQLMVDLTEVIEIDINPLLAHPHGVAALDVRVRIAAPQRSASDRLAIRPYPVELERPLEVGSEDLRIRPARPEDRELVVSALDPDRRSKFACTDLERMAAPRFTQIDYDRELVLLLLGPGNGSSPVLLGLAALYRDPDGARAECVFGLDKRLDYSVAQKFFGQLLEHARDTEVERLDVRVSAELDVLVVLLRSLGFAPAGDDDLLTLEISAFAA